MCIYILAYAKLISNKKDCFWRKTLHCTLSIYICHNLGNQNLARVLWAATPSEWSSHAQSLKPLRWASLRTSILSRKRIRPQLPPPRVLSERPNIPGSSLAVHIIEDIMGIRVTMFLASSLPIGVLLQQTEFGIVMLFYARITGKEWSMGC